ncbi:secondary thiamine-phosphate synthase enzyme YjbQ [Bacteriovorax sp. DB6_IX]|uniref:secondary thiamine-phosphate synthase enzyme YjbQ n=1 Tax=Bacteriovorax sp. DB6_IX TaxID=1353530 RepID=UPI00038A4B9B|nr:secondary thiamine-phosphate synthase enzyme YjbQ [Bacteriovorax sp. DB6_IX]EQC51884.1 secondary thiamine-phosphate synthase enzyme [Bacteriovorax sp. DB6_IX]
MPTKTVIVNTSGEGFYDITESVKTHSKQLIDSDEGLLYIFTMHTSCALTINEAFDPSAKTDMENFMKHLAPRNLSFITHTAEGADDSPSHMKSILLNQNLCLPVENGDLIMGTWQGIYLSEFRDGQKDRKILLKFIRG